MIDKLTYDYIDPVVVEKINELVHAVNWMTEVQELMMRHYHETMDTHYNTSFPKFELKPKD